MTTEAFLAPNRNVSLDDAEVQSSDMLQFETKSFPRKEFVFFAQISLLFIVIIAAIINISMDNGKQEVWIDRKSVV